MTLMQDIEELGHLGDVSMATGRQEDADITNEYFEALSKKLKEGARKIFPDLPENFTQTVAAIVSMDTGGGVMEDMEVSRIAYAFLYGIVVGMDMTRKDES